MNKEDFLRKIEDCNSAISYAEKKKRDFMKQFIKENCPYKVGDKVKVVQKEWNGDVTELFGYVERIQVSDEGVFHPDCATCKKDGTKHSRNKLWISYGSVISIEKV